jgi:Protein of unknown function (DUF3631)
VASSAAATTPIIPMNNNELDALALRTDALRGSTMLTAVYNFLGRFVAYPSDHAQVAHALWCVHTHLMDEWESTPRIAFLSAEKASGKTRALEITELLVQNPVMSVNASPAYLFRKVGNSEEGPATILFDEIDTIFGPKAKENEEIRGLLNAGHRRGATAGRCIARGSVVETEEIPAYAAVALAGLGWLPDTLLSRSVIIRMRRRLAAERVEPYRRRVHAVEGERVREAIELWIPSAEITWPELPLGIEDRDADMWEPLISIAVACGGEWPERARKAAVALVAESKKINPSLGIRLLADLRTIFGAANALSTKTMLELLHNLEEAPWADLKGKPLDARGLADHLDPYGVKSKVVRIEDKTPHGYARADLHDPWQRYLPSPAKSATSATSATSQADQIEDVADTVVDAATGPEQNDAHGINDVADVADVADMAEDADGKGLSWREIERLAEEVEDAAYHYRCENDVELDLEAEVRRRLLGRVFPEHLEVETERVLQCVFGAST